MGTALGVFPGGIRQVEDRFRPQSDKQHPVRVELFRTWQREDRF